MQDNMMFGEELDLLEGILIKYVWNLSFLTCGTFRQWLWVIHKQFILGGTLCSREYYCCDEKDLVFYQSLKWPSY